MKKAVKFIAPAIISALVALVVSLNVNTQVLASHNFEGDQTPSPTPTPTNTPSLTPSPSVGPCVSTDVHGRFEYSGNHLSGNPITGYFYNKAANPDCSDNVYILIFGSRQEPESQGWLKSQAFVKSQTVNVAQGVSDFKVQVDVPNADFCWYQVDATRTSDVRTPPNYAGSDMIDYVFVKDPDSCNPATPTPSPVPTPTPTVGGNTSTNTNNNDNSQEQHQEQNNNQTVNVTVSGEKAGGEKVLSGKAPAKQPDTGVGVLGYASMFSAAPLGVYLARFRKGRKQLPEVSPGEFASNVFEERLQKHRDIS